MSVQALNHVRKLRAGGFPQAVLLYLAMCHNGESGQCNPTRENIREFFSCEHQNCDIKRVDRALAALKRAGLIVSIKQPSKEGVRNWYVFPGLEGTPQNEPTDKNSPNPQNGVHPETGGSPQNGEWVAPKMGLTGSPQNGGGKSKEKSKEKEKYSFSSLPTPESDDASEPDLFGGEEMAVAHTADQTPAPKSSESGINHLISNENRGGSLMGLTPADGDVKDDDNPLNQKENVGADELVRTKEQKAKKSKTVFCTTERPDDVDPDLWSDFLTHRKAKRAPVTATVIKRMRSAAAECQMTLSQAMEMTVVRGWQGFEARYVLKDRVGKAAEKKLPPHKDPAFKFDDDYYSKVNPDNPWEGI